MCCACEQLGLPKHAQLNKVNQPWVQKSKYSRNARSSFCYWLKELRNFLFVAFPPNNFPRRRLGTPSWVSRSCSREHPGSCA
jgi:hypothetical protein